MQCPKSVIGKPEERGDSTKKQIYQKRSHKERNQMLEERQKVQHLKEEQKKQKLRFLIKQFLQEQFAKEDSFTCQEIQNELGTDYKQLFEEARAEGGDPVSKRLVEGINEWLQSQIEVAISDIESYQVPFIRIPSLFLKIVSELKINLMFRYQWAS